MSEVYRKKTLSKLENEACISELILALKRHKLCSNTKNQVAERSKRLQNNYTSVEGRKLDQELNKPGARQFGCRAKNYNDIEKQEKCTVATDKDKEEAKKLQEKLSFNSQKQKVSEIIDLTDEENFKNETINKQLNFSTQNNKEFVKQEKSTLATDNDKEQAKYLQEELKKFAFNFSKQTNINNKVIDIIDLTEEDIPKNKTRNKAVSCNKENIKPLKQVEDIKQIKLEKPKHRLDHMYFVLDTNVLIHSLYLLEHVASLLPLGTSGSLLYVPYMVIQELDKLKCKQPSFAARRAIKYLNNKFENNEKIEAQSAKQNAQLLISIDCPDDSIINCCLQLQQRVPHLMLLTSDNNLRLKAHASFLKVSTCEQLTSYRSNWWSLQRDRRQQRQRYQTRIWF